MFEAFISELTTSGMPYCLLCGYERYPNAPESDVDFMVRQSDERNIAALLMRVATRCGALLIQALRHETGACYFVLAKQVGDEVAYLHPDCSGDYRRDGRLWLTAGNLLARRRQYKSFYVLDEADGFLYYLIKKVLKREVTKMHLRRLKALYLRHSAECCERARRFWSEESFGALITALAKLDLDQIREKLPTLLDELRASGPQEDSFARGKQAIRESLRRLERAANPTGLNIRLSGGSAEQRTGVTRALERNLRPAFRRTMIVPQSEMGVPSTARQWATKIRSTLVIQSNEHALTKRLKRNELRFDIGGTSDVNVDHLTRIVLRRMAGRLEQRVTGGKASRSVTDFTLSVLV
jgi:hypothetical protein